MSDTNSIREEVAKQNAKAAKLPAKQKFKHFWYYYKIPFFVTLGILAFVTYLILHFTLLSPKPYSFSAYALNSAYVKEITSNEETKMDRFFAEFTALQNFDLKKTRAVFDTNLTIDPTSGDNLTLANDLNLIANGQAGDVDLIMGSADLINYYVPNGFYKETIDHYLPADFYEFLSANDMVYSYVDQTDGKKYEIGIFVKDAARMKDTGLYDGTDITEPVAAIVSSYSPRIDTSVAFLEYLFDYPKCLETNKETD